MKALITKNDRTSKVLSDVKEILQTDNFIIFLIKYEPSKFIAKDEILTIKIIIE